MEEIVLRPEREQRTLWFIGWAIPFILGLVLWLVLSITVHKLIFSLCIAGWLIIMLPILLWIPAFYRSLEYEICSDAVKMRKGVVWKKRVTVPYTKITNVDVTQGPLERAFNIGTIHVQTAGAGGMQGEKAELTLLGLRDFNGLKDTIMERVGSLTFSRSEEIKKEMMQGSDSEILRRMLKELTTIREVLEKKQD